MVLLQDDQQFGYLKKLTESLKKSKIPIPTIIALSINAAHESYLNPYTIEGAIFPGPPKGANGVDSGRDGIGLWQWTQQGNPMLAHLGDFDYQVNYMLTNKAQWDVTGSWFNAAGLPDPTPEIKTFDDFLYNTKNYDAAKLTQAFIGYWERPAYNPGTIRYNNAPNEVAEFEPLVKQYYGGGGEDPSTGSPGNGGEIINPDKPDAGKNEVSIEDKLRELLENVKKAYEESTTSVIPDYSPEHLQATNKKFIIKRIYGNAFKINYTGFFNNFINDLINKTPEPSHKPDKPDKIDPTPPPPPSDPTNMDDILTWTKNNLGHSYNYEAAHPGAGAQCVDLIKAINDYVLKDHELTQALSTGNAQDIYYNQLPSNWTRIELEGSIGNDDIARQAWDKAPLGAIVFFYNAPYGHVAVKSGQWAEVYEQNYAGKQYITNENIAGWIASGVGYIGAWARK
jgi:hypothetical protein